MSASLAHGLVLAIAEDALRPAVPGRDAAVQIGGEDGVFHRVLDDQPQAFGAFAQCILGTLAFADVVAHHDRGRGAAVRIGQITHAVVQPERAAVLAQAPLLDVEGFAMFGEAPHQVGAQLPVGGMDQVEQLRADEFVVPVAQHVAVVPVDEGDVAIQAPSAPRPRRPGSRWR